MMINKLKLLMNTVFTVLLLVLTVSCRESKPIARKPSPQPIVYCSVDEAFARDIFQIYRKKTGIEPLVVFDSEAGKTTGLVNRILAEAQSGRPRCDVFWSSELFGTILLARRNLLESYRPPNASDIPTRYKDPQHRWTAIASRARVIAFDPNRVSPQELPTHWEQLANPEYSSVTAIANPLFGTTRGHVAAMFALWGSNRSLEFLHRIKSGGILIVDGNSSAVRAVIAGKVKLAMTDTDDVWVAQQAGYSIDMRYLDMGDGGTLLIPNSVAMIRGGPNPQAARSLIDFLVSKEVERLLAQSPSKNYPVRSTLIHELGIQVPPETKISFDEIADAMEESVNAVRKILIR